MSASPGRSTRERLLEEGLRLFAEQGYDSATVGEIEAAAGLQPRRGAMYRHFESKRDLLVEAVRAHWTAVNQAGQRFQLDAYAGDLDRLIGDYVGWLLKELDRQRALTHILERDGHQFPELRAAFLQGSNSGLRMVSRSIADLAATLEVAVDADALAVLLVGGVINYRRSDWTFGGRPLRLSQRRLADGFRDLLTAALRPT